VGWQAQQVRTGTSDEAWAGRRSGVGNRMEG